MESTKPLKGQLKLDREDLSYWLELEGLLARFYHDLSRVIVTLEALGEEVPAGMLSAARWQVGGACLYAAQQSTDLGSP